MTLFTSAKSQIVGIPSGTPGFAHAQVPVHVPAKENLKEA